MNLASLASLKTGKLGIFRFSSHFRRQSQFCAAQDDFWAATHISGDAGTLSTAPAGQSPPLSEARKADQLLGSFLGCNLPMSITGWEDEIQFLGQ